MLSKKFSVLSAALLAVSLGFAAGAANAAQAKQKSAAPAKANGYVQANGATVKSGFGLCVGTGYFTPDMQTRECAAAAKASAKDTAIAPARAAKKSAAR